MKNIVVSHKYVVGLETSHSRGGLIVLFRKSWFKKPCETKLEFKVFLKTLKAENKKQKIN